MAGDNTSTVAPGEMACPDPSVHVHHQKLSEQASTAALYVTHPERQTEVMREVRENPLGPDGKLSSKSAATSLKYARAQDLPSFPSHGHAADSAGKAAMLAKDYKMKQLWQPEASAAGSKAAFVAAGKGGKIDLWQPSPSANSNSAATLAMRNRTLSPKIDYGYTDDGKSKALLAATMSHSRGRARATSTPVPPAPTYPDSRNAVANALSAATLSHRASVRSPDGWDSEANQAARIKNLGNHMDRAMFTERPPVEPEIEEAKYNTALRASAISMAKQMYDYQTQKDAAAAAAAADLAGGSAEVATRNVPATTQPDLKEEAMRYIHLQDAAHKLAAERLAKVDKDREAERYREYYGYGNEGKNRRISKRLSIRSGRKRASSEGTADFSDSDDEEQARRIRNQMSQLHTGVTTIDSRKQQDDRARLLAAAEKRVSARMQDMDTRVFAETGKVSPAMMEEWEAKARKRAQEEREQDAAHPGKTHIGGGKYMAQSEIEAIALARLKPTLDEINDTAEKRRARDEEIRLEKEEQERLRREEKVKNREEKDDQRRFKNEIKARKDEEKAAIKKEKEEEKARKTEEKRIAKEDKRKSREVAKDSAAIVAGGAALSEVADRVKEGNDEATAAEAVQKHRSALGRLRDRFRRDHDDDDDLTDERPTTSHSTKAVATGAAAGAATGIVADDLVDDHRPVELPTSRDAPATEVVPSASEATPAGVLATPAVPEAVVIQETPAENVTSVTIVQPPPGPTAEELTAASTLPSAAAGDELDQRKAPEIPPSTFLDYSNVITTDSGVTAASAAIAAQELLDENEAKERQASNRDDISRTYADETALATHDAAPVIPSTVIVEDFDQSTDTLPPVDATRPLFEQQPSLSGYTNDALPTLASTHKPNLERHISQIPENDEELSDEDSDDEAIQRAAQYALLERRITRERTNDVADGVREDIADPSPAIIEDKQDETSKHEQVLVPMAVTGQPAAMVFDKQDPALGLLGIGSAAVAAPRSYKSKERIDDLLHESQGPQDEPEKLPVPVLPIEPTNKEAEKSLSTHPEAVGRTPVHPAEPAVVAQVQSTESQKPRESRESREYRAGNTTAHNVATPATEYIRKSSVDLERKTSRKKQVGAFVAGVATAGLATVDTTTSKKDAEDTRQKPEKERHGFRGFINRVTHRHSKSENKLHDDHAVSYDKHTAANKPSSSATTGYAAHKEQQTATSTTATSVVPPTLDTTNVSSSAAGTGAVLTGDEAESPSSFRRGEPDPTNADDLSSSGADEDDIGRGRERRGLARKLGFGGKDHRHLLHKDPPPEIVTALAAPETGAHVNKDSAAGADEQYEEARDHFDESLAPPPAFAGQRKSESPIRETKFQEEL